MAKKIPSWHEDTTLFDPAARVEGLQGAATELHIAVEGLERRLCPLCWVARCLCSCYSRYSRLRFCREWRSWHPSCLVQRTSCKGNSRVVAQCLIRSGGGDPISAWGFPWGQAVDGLIKFLCGWFSVDLFHERQALDGIEGCSHHNILSGVEVRIVFHPSLHLCPLSVMTSPVVDSRGTVLFCTGPIAVLMPSYIPLMFPVIADFWFVSQSSKQYSLAQCLGVCRALLLAAQRISLRNRFYSARAQLYSLH